MTERQPADARLIRYLLGDALPDAEQAEIEGRYFADDLYFDRLLAIEDDLIDSHVRGVLPDGMRTRFEQHFLASGRRREKWEAQRAIAAFFRARSEPVDFVNGSIRFFALLTPWRRLVFGFSALLLIAGVGFLSLRYLDIRRESSSRQSRLVALQNQVARLPAIATFALRPERMRSGSGDQIRIAMDTRWVLLRVALSELAMGYSSFAAGLSTADGQEVWRQNGLSRMGSVVEVDLPGSVLPPGDYVLSMSAGVDAKRISLSSYQFRVDR